MSKAKKPPSEYVFLRCVGPTALRIAVLREPSHVPSQSKVGLKDNHRFFTNCPSIFFIALVTSKGDLAGALTIAAVIFLALYGYFWPSILAVQKDRRNKDAVMVLNLTLGWTVVGWVVALVWVLSRDAVLVEEVATSSSPLPFKHNYAVKATEPYIKLCPFCAEEVRAKAIKCKHCGSDLSAA